MRILITGGAGFIGRHLTELLRRGGHTVTILDLVDFPDEADITSPGDVKRAVEGVDLVVHLAASTDIRRALEDPWIDFDSARGTLTLLQGMKRANVRDIVFASSGAVYGETGAMFYEHRNPELPISLYGASKLYGEALISSYCSIHGFRGIALRPANVIGSDRKQGVIFDFAKQICETGRIHVLGNGEQAKSYIHVSDAAEGFALAARLLQEEPDGYFEAFNLTSIGTVSVASIAKAMMVKILGIVPDDDRVTFGEGPRGWPGDVPMSELSPTKFASRGFHAHYTSKLAVLRVLEELRA